MDNVSKFLDPLFEKLGSFVPDAIGAALVLIIGLILCSLIRRATAYLLAKIKLDARINKEREKPFEVEKAIAFFVYYLFLLYVLLLVLDILGVEGVLVPLQNMFDEFVSYIPNIIAAGVIGFAGFVIARVVSVVVGVAAKGVDALSERLGLAEKVSLSNIAQQLVFVFIFVPILIVALDALQMEAISAPATGMLNELLAAIPEIIGAAIILAVFYIAGRFVVSMLVELLQNIGADQLPEKLGLQPIVGESVALSRITGKVVFFFIMFTAIISALEKLNMTGIGEVLSGLLVLAGQIVLGLVILAVGNYFANLASKLLSQGEDNAAVASIARYGVLALVVAIGLNAMGIADTIVHLAFGLTLGAIAVAVALSFGLGGREAAGRQMEYILSKFRKQD